MLQLTRVYMGNSMFRGNASLNGQLSHLLDQDNVTQVLPLEPPDAWARRREVVTTYLSNFRNLVKLFNRERPTKCEWYPGQGWCPEEGEPLPRGRGMGVALRDRSVKGWGHMCKTSLWAKGALPWSREFLTAHPGNGIMLNLLLLLRKRAGGCSL